MIIKVYLTISILAAIVLMINSLLDSEDDDLNGKFETIEEKVELIQSPKIKEMMLNIVDICLQSDVHAKILYFLCCFTPILNVFVLIISIKNLHNNINFKD